MPRRFGVYDHLDPFLANRSGRAGDDACTRWWRPMRCLPMAASGSNRHWWTGCRIAGGAPFIVMTTRECTDCSVSEALTEGHGADAITSDRERVMDPITAFQLTSMMEGVVTRGSGSGVEPSGRRLPARPARPTTQRTCGSSAFRQISLPVATWDTISRALWARAPLGGTLCVPVFQAFMQEAIKKYGGAPFRVPTGWPFHQDQQLSPAKDLSDDASGDFRPGRIFPRRGQDTLFGLDTPGGWRFCHGPEPAAFHRRRIWRR